MTSFASRVTEILTDFAWRSWTTIGVAGVSRPYRDVAVDPEALVVITSVVGASDPRLRDEAIDWCAQFHSSISTARLRGFLSLLSAKQATSFSKFAATVNEHSSAKWRAPQNQFKPYDLRLSGKSKLDAIEQPASIRLRLRMMFGVGARAEVLAAILGRPGRPVTAAELTSIGYTKRNIATVLDELRQGGILATRADGNKLVYVLHKGAALAELAGPVPKKLVPWRHIAQFCLRTVGVSTIRFPKARLVEANRLWERLEGEFVGRGMECPGRDGDLQQRTAAWESWSVQQLQRLASGKSKLLLPAQW